MKASQLAAFGEHQVLTGHGRERLAFGHELPRCVVLDCLLCGISLEEWF
jgi:hypothetical protein